MARPKKNAPKVIAEVPEKVLISPLSVDYPSESLNDMARKINELIDYLNAEK